MYISCSKCRPSVPIQAFKRRCNDCRTRSKTPGVSLILAEASMIVPMRYCSDWIGVSYTKLFKCPHEYKSFICHSLITNLSLIHSEFEVLVTLWTKHFRPNRYWEISVYFNGPNLMLMFIQESAGHPYVCIIDFYLNIARTV